MPETGYYIYKELKDYKRAFKSETLEEAIEIAKNYTSKGKICLLSPAASSYNSFKNFEEKGDLFKKLVQNIK